VGSDMSTINAGTTSTTALVQTADTTGNLLLQSNGTTIVTISPNGLQSNVGAPAFSAYQNSSQTIASGGAFYKVQFQVKEFDTNNNFDNITNYRFTPTVAGYYQFSAAIGWAANANSGVAVTLYKNGSLYKIGTYVTNGNIGPVINLSCLANANGSTDYFEIYVVNNTSASLSLNATSPYTYFQAAMVRSA
jgi:hypothetical protein